MNILKYKWWYFVISGLIIVPGLLSLIFFGLKLGIDYTGGTLWEIKFSQPVAQQQVAEMVAKNGIEIGSVSQTAPNTFLFRTKPVENAKKVQVKNVLDQQFGKSQELQYETVGPTISGKLNVMTFLYPVIYPLKFFGLTVPDDNITKAFVAVFWASVAILVYIAYSFRKLPNPASSWRFGVAAIVALLHDVLLVVGLFSIFGLLFGVEVDALFITAVLTVMGFSIHDTIVVFDRIRENLEKYRNMSFTEVVNASIVQTLGRSLMTSLTVVFVLLALLLFGGVSIRWFVAALLAGIISGTYSSIFNASPLLVVWQDWQKKRQ